MQKRMDRRNIQAFHFGCMIKNNLCFRRENEKNSYVTYIDKFF